MKNLPLIIGIVLLAVFYFTIILYINTLPYNFQLVFTFIIMISVYPSAFLLIILSKYKK